MTATWEHGQAELLSPRPQPAAAAAASKEANLSPPPGCLPVPKGLPAWRTSGLTDLVGGGIQMVVNPSCASSSARSRTWLYHPPFFFQLHRQEEGSTGAAEEGMKGGVRGQHEGGHCRLKCSKSSVDAQQAT